MKKTAYLLVLILLAIVAGCDLFKPDDNDLDQGWLDIESFYFPVYMGHFADYEYTDADGNHLGSVTYGEDGSDNDWQVFEYDASDKALETLQGLIPIQKPKDTYYICVKAYDAITNGELPAYILLNGSPTGYTAPYTFTHTGSYDPSLEGQYSVDYSASYSYYYVFLPPEVTFNQETSTYIYSFSGIPYYIDYLESFTATLTEQYNVLLTWVTESETAMSGFRLYRSDSTDLSSAQVITDYLIPATNTSQEHVYNFTDTEVVLGDTYYYWVEYVFIEYSSFHGPVYISLLPVVNDVSYAYPNPCQDSFYLNIDVKLCSTATVLLLDAQHVIRKTYQLEDGSQFLNMDVSNLEPGLYRTFIWFHDGHYAYGDVLIQD